MDCTLKKQLGYKVSLADNVATLMQDTVPGTIKLIGDAAKEEESDVLENIPFGHKVALQDIAEGNPVIKYGVKIGVAYKNIKRGQCVHLHNIKSNYDFYSAGFDPESAEDPEIEYELYNYGE